MSIRAKRFLVPKDGNLPDHNDDAAAFELSGCKGYTAALRESLTEMVRQVGPADVTVRHLVLPDGIAAPEKVMALIGSISAQIKVNVMSQYRPVYRASKFPVMSHGVTPAEVSRAVAAARDAGLDNVFVDGRAASRASCPPPQPR